MRRRFLILCFACLALLFVGCGQESTVYSGGLPEIEAPSSESKRPESVSSSEKVLSSSSSSENSLISYGKLVDKRNDAVYRTVKIGEQTWMAENLNYETEYSFCYNDSLENCEMYGRLYYWSAAMDSAGEYGKNARGCGFRSGCDVVLPVRGVCPEGWHLPSSSDVKVLAAAAGGMAVAGKMLKSVNNWIYGGGFDLYGFSMLPSGARNDNGGYLGLGSYAYFWTTNYVNDGVKTQADVFEFDFDKNQTTVLRYLKNGAMSVRCVKDDSSEKDTVSKTQPNIILGSFTDSRDDQKYKTVTIGEQVWMAQNLNYECKKSYCYNNSFDGCDRFGRFYDWSTAQNVCPKGWHLPGKKEWNELFAEVGGAKNAGLVLRADSVWRRENRGSDAYGFFALPAGFRDYSGMYSGGASSYNDEYAFFWTSARKNDSYSYYVFMTSGASETGFSYSDKNDYRSVRCVRDEPASSSSEKVSSSSEKVSSSSVKSSSSVSPTSSSGKTVNRTFLWDGTIDTEGQVETGSPDETAGYWYDFSDRDVGGSSKFIFPSDVEEREDGNFYGPLVEYYMGIRASVSFGDDYDPPYQPYAGIGFNVWSVNQEGVDVSAWGGICLTFQSTIAFSIELGIEDEATIMAYEKYRASVPESKFVTTIDFPWSKFKTGVWGPSASIEDVLKKVAAIKLKFEGSAGATGEFLIQKIGSLGQCGGLGLL